jgi:hypothetical protein
VIRKVLAALGGVVAAGALLAAAPAHAAGPKTYTAQNGENPISIAAYSSCPAARSCIFNNLNGGTPYGSFASGDGDLADSSGPRGLNNSTESVWNRTGQYWCYYDGGGFNVLIFIVGPGFQGNLDAVDRNKVSSLRICP